MQCFNPDWKPRSIRSIACTKWFQFAKESFFLNVQVQSFTNDCFLSPSEQINGECAIFVNSFIVAFWVHKRITPISTIFEFFPALQLLPRLNVQQLLELHKHNHQPEQLIHMPQFFSRLSPLEMIKRTNDTSFIMYFLYWPGVRSYSRSEKLSPAMASDVCSLKPSRNSLIIFTVLLLAE